MPRSRPRRLIALVTAAALLASLTVATVAAPASAAKPKCQGKTATIVGTKKNDVIRGTARRDIIVAKGGADRIYAKGGNDLICAGNGNDTVFGGVGADTVWGQAGHDRLNGNAGPDFLAGQVGNDTLNGGIGVDTCYQGTGSGPVSTCERPAPPPAPAPPDSDSDGIPDGSDACPLEGDRGWGLDATGCPVPPVAVTYVAITVDTYRPVLTWSGLEPGSNLYVMVRFTGGSSSFNMASFNGTGSGGPVAVPGITISCASTVVSVTTTATEAGGTQQEYAAPEPDISSLCP